MIKLSATGKMPCKSWSLQALDTCPGSKAADGSLVDACKGCYATTGAYVWSTTKAPRLSNQEDWKREEWIQDMVKAIGKDKYFRWFDSGDMYALGLAEKMFQVMVQTPGCQHWLPTRMHKFAKFAEILEAMEELPNVMVRRSSDSVLGEYTPGVHGSTITPDGVVPAGAVICSAPSQGGKCLTCRACWSKDVPVVAYVAHGRSMAKVIRLAITA
jgi:hypothetical protein